MRAQIGFAIHDAARDARAFGVEAGEGETLVFGAEAPIAVRERGVLPAHLIVLRYGGQWLAASAMDAAPAYLGNQPLPSQGWIVLPVPSRVRIGAAFVDVFATPQAAQGAHSATPQPQPQPPTQPSPPMHPSQMPPQAQAGHHPAGTHRGHPGPAPGQHAVHPHPAQGHPHAQRAPQQPQHAHAQTHPSPGTAPTGHAVTQRPAQASSRARPRPPTHQPDNLDATIVKPLETIAAENRSRQLSEASVPGVVNPLLQPQPASPKTPVTAKGSVAVAAARRLRQDWQSLSTPKRMMLPLAALLAIFVVARPSRGDDETVRVDETARFVPDAANAAGNPSGDSSKVAATGESEVGAGSVGAAVENDLQALPSSETQPAAGVGVAQDPSAFGGPTNTLQTGTPGVGAGLPTTAPAATVLPSARSLPRPEATPLSKRERAMYDKAIEATFAGDWGGAYALYEQLAQAHPEATEFRAIQRILVQKIRAQR